MREEESKRAGIYSGRRARGGAAEGEVSCSLERRQDRLEGLQGASEAQGFAWTVDWAGFSWQREGQTRRTAKYHAGYNAASLSKSNIYVFSLSLYTNGFQELSESKHHMILENSYTQTRSRKYLRVNIFIQNPDL